LIKPSNPTTGIFFRWENGTRWKKYESYSSSDIVEKKAAIVVDDKMKKPTKSYHSLVNKDQASSSFI
jgi:hypothetical protein